MLSVLRLLKTRSTHCKRTCAAAAPSAALAEAKAAASEALFFIASNMLRGTQDFRRAISLLETRIASHGYALLRSSAIDHFRIHKREAAPVVGGGVLSHMISTFCRL